MELRRLRGKELRKALLAGIIKVQDLKDELNKINIWKGIKKGTISRNHKSSRP